MKKFKSFWTKNWWKKNLIALGLLGFFFAMGLFFGLNSWDKNLYVQWKPSEWRGLAGEGSSKEILNLSTNQLTQKASLALFSKNQVIEEDSLLAFYLGNFLVHDPQLKELNFICQIYPLVEFSFFSIGFALNNEPGAMVVQSPCKMEDEEWIGPFYLPHKEMLAHPERNFFVLSDQGVFVRFYNSSISLTPSWLLTNVRFFEEGQEDKELLIHFTPGDENPYFELSLKNATAVE